jgi:DNA-binding GntR family transcriptional regulator
LANSGNTASEARGERHYAYRQDSGSMASQIYDQLMARILDMEFRPFQELSEARLAAEFGVSRTPVREALARLARRGLVDIFPQRGTLVSPLSVQRVARSRFIREALERPLARLAAENVTAEQIAQLEREIALQRTFGELNDDQSFIESDDNFHALIARTAGFESIWDDVREAKFHMDRVRRLSLLSQEHMRRLVIEHNQILDRLKAHDPDGAEAAIRAHLTSVMVELETIQAMHPEYFSDG